MERLSKKGLMNLSYSLGLDTTLLDESTWFSGVPTLRIPEADSALLFGHPLWENNREDYLTSNLVMLLQRLK
ncbi:hypothetical protein H1D32_24160 [Anaerobacillus sp. CMMVII]|uniref:hypothetical protein n=1 Tax=Anaerobacillus sp. CMMVII TaxID=2755588 RepID=UPI0021B73E76|nr:hypothetical protein [Anaerobacillus sp. CMMVII]MCT8140495.1 hypothetical protein [Anaerobacillus sp. CMMVII]